MLSISKVFFPILSLATTQLNQAQTRRQTQLNNLTHQLVQTEERERRRIAGILHDSSGQTLAATKWEMTDLLRHDPSE